MSNIYPPKINKVFTPSKLETEVEAALGISLPDGAKMTVTNEGGIQAKAYDATGTMTEWEVGSNGDQYFSKDCNSWGLESMRAVKSLEGDVTYEPSCRNAQHVLQSKSGPIGLDKLAKAKALILKGMPEAVIVQKGDTLSGIIREKMGVSVQESGPMAEEAARQSDMEIYTFEGWADENGVSVAKLREQMEKAGFKGDADKLHFVNIEAGQVVSFKELPDGKMEVRVWKDMQAFQGAYADSRDNNGPFVSSDLNYEEIISLEKSINIMLEKEYSRKNKINLTPFLEKFVDSIIKNSKY
ncbi:MAG: hypothetical protein Q7T03_03000 [Deltaproteobacteria bacterium]|nr:hypothetical protein [Deltaproteobacteria bacterium]